MWIDTGLHSGKSPARVAESVDAGDSKAPATSAARANAAAPNEHRCTGAASPPVRASTTDLTTCRAHARRALVVDAETLAVLRTKVSYDPATGRLTWLVGGRGWRAGQEAGTVCRSTGYLIVEVGGRKYRGHRLAWMLAHGPVPPRMVVDHIDRSRTNNRLENLRLATYAENWWNSDAGDRAVGGAVAGGGEQHDRAGRAFGARIRHVGRSGYPCRAALRGQAPP